MGNSHTTEGVCIVKKKELCLIKQGRGVCDEGRTSRSSKE
jgi:hypothetical protein